MQFVGSHRLQGSNYRGPPSSPTSSSCGPNLGRRACLCTRAFSTVPHLPADRSSNKLFIGFARDWCARDLVPESLSAAPRMRMYKCAQIISYYDIFSSSTCGLRYRVIHFYGNLLHTWKSTGTIDMCACTNECDSKCFALTSLARLYVVSRSIDQLWMETCIALARRGKYCAIQSLPI